ncbi:hypothetical protein [Halorhodospira halophila]|uniref:hypothetical protein n=1 Tax=Halorhodospira halophila TaxID=1053 RepID=UPI001912A7C7|nr:hypothetical protein [Halorhodospira halophila]
MIQIPFFMRGGSQIQDLQSREVDLAREMGLEGGVRITNLPGRPGYAAAEIPRQERRVPHIRELGPPEEESYPSIALGQTLAGEPYRVELDQLPHLLVAGRSGSWRLPTTRLDVIRGVAYR